MMEKLFARGEQIAAEARQLQLQKVAQRLRRLFGGAAVAIEDGQAVVRGKGIVKRWLIEPSVRFIAAAFK